MQCPPGEERKTLSGLVLIPGKLNYYYNLTGHRIAESLRELGLAVDIGTLTSYPDKKYDISILVNITEVVLAFGNPTAGLEEVRRLKLRSRVVVSCCLDCVRTRWYQYIRGYCQESGVEAILDLGLYDQSEFLPSGDWPSYHFIYSGLTTSERHTLEQVSREDGDRPIPWAFIGHCTRVRAALADFLVQTVDPRGFVYLPDLEFYTESGSPHLNQDQYEAVLRRSRYQIWCSHHRHFYLETERFRLSLLTGSVPVKVIFSRARAPRDTLFPYLLMEPGMLRKSIRPGFFEEVRQRFREDFRRLKPLASGLADYLAQWSIFCPEETRPGNAAAKDLTRLAA